ncbi:hypothetical protein GQ53DRAFT_833231 [Thozetella sp. PMI_491]|nr:hypothetical protein GQ53DRAFT_833231 [Thozetella sp. PMI_491]
MPVSPNTVYEYITKSIGQLKDARQKGSNFKKEGLFVKNLIKATSLFPEGTFVDLESDISFFQKNSLRLQTELCWALSKLPATDDFDSAQMGQMAYEGLLHEYYQKRLSDDNGGLEFMFMCKHVTNNEANWELITEDTTKRPNMVIGPRAGIGRIAFMFSNAINFGGGEDFGAKVLWVQRCGDFPVFI